jgi:hypothetical protein
MVTSGAWGELLGALPSIEISPSMTDAGASSTRGRERLAYNVNRPLTASG